ncbi:MULTISPECIES: diguanylate cyclase [Sphingomonas]|uniref:diguanylate cyclase n=1 Tax=Sphingomonas molluscorum TaxID=418184 RepID=A0ABU8Q8Z9_9SPHN
MRLATITNWAYGTTVALALLSGGTMLLASQAQNEERAAVAQRYALDQASSKVAMLEASLSGRARQFVVTGTAADLAAYERGRSELRTIEHRIRRVQDVGAGPDELQALKDALGVLDDLQDEQQAAVAARLKGDKATAVEILFSPNYEQELDRANSLFERFQYRLDQRTETEVAGATKVARIWRTVSEVVLAITALLFLCVLFFIFKRRVLHPVVKLSDVVKRLAAQDYAAVPPNLEQIDEIGDMAQAIGIFRDNGLERLRLEEEQNADRNMRDLLSRMTQRMQASDTLDDLKDVIERFTPQIALGYAGRLYILDKPRQAMVEICSWLDPVHSRTEFSPLSCWALRRGLPHRTGGQNVDVPCDHLQAGGDDEADFICLPLTAQREILGLLYLERRGDAQQAPTRSDVYLTMLAENIGLAVANLRLRDALREMAMADPLTGLANRRHLDAVLGLELAAGERPLSCLMMDVDHFKRINDSFGHDAGDAVLREVGATLKGSSREGALAFRFGGEEFLLLLPGLSLDQARERAEEVRGRIAAMRIEHEGKDLGTITASFGVSSTPEVCGADKLVQTADAALLRAKAAGRNRVVAADRRQEHAVA